MYGCNDGVIGMPDKDEDETAITVGECNLKPYSEFDKICVYASPRRITKFKTDFIVTLVLNRI